MHHLDYEIPLTIFAYPFEKGVKAISNLMSRRKIVPSLARLLAIAGSIVVAIYVPRIPEISIYLIALMHGSLGLSAVAALNLSSVVLAIVLCGITVALVKKAFQSYYKKKYGFSNSEYRLTNRDRALYRKLYQDRVSESELQTLLEHVEHGIQYLAIQIEKFKATERASNAYMPKYILNRLKEGDLESFENYRDNEIERRNLNIKRLREAINDINSARVHTDNDLQNDDRDAALLRGTRGGAQSSDLLQKIIKREIQRAESSSWQPRALVPSEVATRVTRRASDSAGVDVYKKAFGPVERANMVLHRWKRYKTLNANDPALLVDVMRKEEEHQLEELEQVYKLSRLEKAHK